MYRVLNKLSEYTQLCISNDITSNAFLLVSKTTKSLQCILKQTFSQVEFFYIFECCYDESWLHFTSYFRLIN